MYVGRSNNSQKHHLSSASFDNLLRFLLLQRDSLYASPVCSMAILLPKNNNIHTTNLLHTLDFAVFRLLECDFRVTRTKNVVNPV